MKILDISFLKWEWNSQVSRLHTVLTRLSHWQAKRILILFKIHFLLQINVLQHNQNHLGSLRVYYRTKIH